MLRAVALLLLAAVLGGPLACRRGAAARRDVAAPVIPAGFVEQRGTGWQLAMPAAWQRLGDSPQPAWIAVDPQPVNDYRANVSVVTEPFKGESHDYARANEAVLRRQPGASVEAAREDVVDGDSTLIVEARWSLNPQSAVEYRTMQTHLASRGTGYVITCSVAVTAFERFRSTCESIVRSFAVER
jgi:hypothetical protein